jgi:SAM-dependent methyltransferase
MSSESPIAIPRAPAWEDSICHEVQFWEDFIASEGRRWNDPEIAADFRTRLDPEALLDEPELLARLGAVPSDDVWILDVGAGPLTVLGKRHQQKSLKIVAVDPLAQEYDRMLARAGIDPPVRTRRCFGDRLLDRFGPEVFDFAYARNCLDHSADPLPIIRNMLAVVKKGRYVVLKHLRNEAERAHYDGLHQWNFDLAQGRPVVWSRIVEHDLLGELAGEAHVEAGYDGGWVTCILTKPAL